MPKSEGKKTTKKKSWKDLAPKTKKDRLKMLKVCGPSCFLDPENLTYPICPKSNIKIKSSEPTEQGIRAAYTRAIIVQNSKVASIARQLMKEKFNINLV